MAKIGEVGKRKHLSMAYSLTVPIFFCKRTILVQLILEDVVSCVFGTQYSYASC